MALRWQWDLPLFAKELQELAARRRTYVIRVVYVALLCYFAMGTLAITLQNPNPLSALGQGLPVLTSLVNWEFTGIYLFLPAMACGVFTTEKERNTLALLFLTRLGPWTLIIEKLLSRLFPMLMFLCSALPVMAFTYSMGGLTAFQIFCAAWILLLAVFQITCIAVMCSTLSSSTATAFLQTYFVIFLMGNVLPVVVGSFVPYRVLDTALQFLFGWTARGPAGRVQISHYFGLHPQTLLQVLSPQSLFEVFMNPRTGLTRGSGLVGGVTLWLPALVLGIPSFLSGIGCLCIARWALYRRAFVLLSNPLLKFFRGIDKIFFWFHRHVAFDVKLVREADTLPGDEPIAWREVSKRSLGQFRYLVRIMVPLLFPVIFVGIFTATASANEWQGNGPNNVGLTPLVLFLWIVSLVLIAVTAANTVPLERTRQTWDVLRSMPLTGREILEQKLRGVRRLQWVCSIPVLSAIGLQAWWRYQLLTSGLSSHQPGVRFHDDQFLWWEYLVGAVASVWIYSELVKWIAMWCGLMFRNSMRAILSSALFAAAFATVPYVLFVVVYLFIRNTILLHLIPPPAVVSAWWGLWAICPVLFTVTNEIGDLRTISSIPLIPAIIQILSQGALLWLLHRHIVGRAEWYLGRIGIPPRRISAGQRVADESTQMEELERSPVAGVAS